MTYHERLKGQSKEIFRLKGGRHVRADKNHRHIVTILAGDTCHITKDEAEKFSDRWEVVELPVSAADVTIEEETEEVAEEETEEVAEEETEEVAEVIEPLDRPDFSSDSAFQKWIDADEPDLSNVPRTGHSGRTYSVKDVQAVI